MVKCPQCSEDIDTIECEEERSLTYTFDIESDVYEDVEASIVSIKYMCPACHGVIFESEDELMEYIDENRIDN